MYPLLYPRTKAVRVRDRIVSLSILLHLMANPLLLAFSDRLHTVLPHSLLFLCDIVWWVDMALRFATAHEERSTSAAHSVTTIVHPALIAARYLRGDFLLDAVAALPYYFIVCGPWAGFESCIDRALAHTLLSHPIASDSPAFASSSNSSNSSNGSVSDSLLAATTDAVTSLATNATAVDFVGPLLSAHAAVPVVMLLGTLRAWRILRTPSERSLLLSNEHGIRHFIWWFQLAQPALIFLYLSRACRPEAHTQRAAQQRAARLLPHDSCSTSQPLRRCPRPRVSAAHASAAHASAHSPRTLLTVHPSRSHPLTLRTRSLATCPDVCGCLFWYVSVLELEHGLRRSPPVIPWPDFSGQEYLPPRTYATCTGHRSNRDSHPFLC